MLRAASTAAASIVPACARPFWIRMPGPTIRVNHATGAVGVERGPEDVVRRRTVEAVGDVVLARPHHLHRLVDGLRRLDRVHDEVELAAPAEAAAEERRIDG